MEAAGRYYGKDQADRKRIATCPLVISAYYRLKTLGYGNLAHVSDRCKQKLCIENCCQTAVDSDIVATDRLGSRHRPIQRYNRRLLMTCRLATIHTLQTNYRQQPDTTLCHIGPIG